ncbi:Alcohol dehydrogenase [hydrothermal vent metagenome]|uniref:Alcohol dehydrogenase n=1 Tax=hydrothermal vent metagenome TaxID=652676 RepID=A0A3B0XG80_9ZZZZ
MNLFNFSIARLPRIVFSRGAIKQIPEICLQYGTHVLLVTGARSFESSDGFLQLKKDFEKNNIQFEKTSIPGEPSPDIVDQAVSEFHNHKFDVVLGIGGGSALDAAKAIAGLLNVKKSVMDYLEGVGAELKYSGPAVPFIAVPTTAGTGSEATKNAVLSVQGKNGFKKSFRDDKLVAEYAVIDPELLVTCPKNIIAANGMDALTQLIESYVSTRANEMTDALALSGVRAARDSLLNLYNSVSDEDAQNKMAYASLMSGICLAQTGLGSVHGLASPLGAFYPIPHGVVCGTLVAQATKMNIELMLQREPTNLALDKYAVLGDVITHQHCKNKHESRALLCETLQHWTDVMHIPKLGEFGLTEAGLDDVIANSRGSSMQTNPIKMTDREIRELLEK